MIWLTWRQHRGQIVAVVVGLLVLGAFLAVTGRQMRDAFATSGLEACLRALGTPEFVPIDASSNCVELGDAFAARFFNLRLLALVAFLVLPALLGMFLGAPVVARELEQGTYRLVWTQGVSRRRWAIVTFTLLGVFVLLLGSLFAVAVELWFEPLNRATGQRFTWLIFDQQGAVVAGYAVFAFALGVFFGSVTRRTLRAMGITLLVFLLVRFGVAVWIRTDLAARVERTYPVVATTMPNGLVGDWIIGGGGPGVGGCYDADGQKVQGGQSFCEPDRAQECIDEYGQGAYNLEIYQPADRFWRFQYPGSERVRGALGHAPRRRGLVGAAPAHLIERCRQPGPLLSPSCCSSCCFSRRSSRSSRCSSSCSW